jgi:hypothetical protein
MLLSKYKKVFRPSRALTGKSLKQFRNAFTTCLGSNQRRGKITLEPVKQSVLAILSEAARLPV